jgi:hypothetical protein
MWQEAQRVAAKYGIGDIPLSLPKGTGSSGKTDGLGGLKKAMCHEQKPKYECGREEPSDQVFERALRVPRNFITARLRDVATTLAQLVMSMNRNALLGKILENREVYMDASEIYKLVQTWEDANRLSRYLDR